MNTGSASPESSVQTNDTTTEGSISAYSSGSEDEDSSETQDSSSGDKNPKVRPVHRLGRPLTAILMFGM